LCSLSTSFRIMIWGFSAVQPGRTIVKMVRKIIWHVTERLQRSPSNCFALTNLLLDPRYFIRNCFCGEKINLRTQPSLPVSQALAPCARQPGFRARRQALLLAPKSTLHESRHALGETLHISILAAHDAPV